MVWHNARLAQDNLTSVELRLFLIEAFNLLYREEYDYATLSKSPLPVSEEELEK